jgi:hypothetical protein
MKILNLICKRTNCYLLESSCGWIMIDTDFPGTLYRLMNLLNQHNIKISDIKYLIVTHFHPDHAGKERLINMVLWGIFISAFLIGFSGAMMPGPMLGVTIDGSLKKGWTAGPLTVLGHGILELILIIIMTFGLKDFFSNPTVAGFIGLFGGAFLAWMGYGMIKSGINKSVSLEKTKSRE